MAWAATDNFDSYTVGGNLSGGAGGTDWSTNWAKDVETGDVTTETAPSGGQGGVAAQAAANAAATASYVRTFTAISAGTMRILMRRVNTTGSSDCNVTIGTGDIMIVRFANTGQIQRFTAGAYADITAWTANTWHKIDIDFDDAAQNDQYRVRVDEGAYTAFGSTNGAFTTVDRIHINHPGGGATSEFWWDCVGDVSNACAVVAVRPPQMTMLGVGG